MLLHMLVIFRDRRLLFLLGNTVLLMVFGGLQLGVPLQKMLLVVPLLLVVGCYMWGLCGLW
jgi:hypothetical protein